MDETHLAGASPAVGSSGLGPVRWVVLAVACLLFLPWLLVVVLQLAVALYGDSMGISARLATVCLAISPFVAGASSWVVMGRRGHADPVFRIAISISVAGMVPVAYLVGINLLALAGV